MSYLLDTHVLLWLLGKPERIPGAVRRRLEDRRQLMLVSAASAFEISMKVRSGKLPTAIGVVDGWTARLRDLSAEELPISGEHAVAAGALSWGHRDPFDRLLVAQALSENVTLVTKEQAILEFPGLKTLAI